MSALGESHNGRNPSTCCEISGKSPFFDFGVSAIGADEVTSRAWHFAVNDPDFPIDAVPEETPDNSVRPLLRKTTLRKKATQAIGATMAEIGHHERANRLLNCTNRLLIDRYANGTRVSRKTRCCRDALCEVCAERLARKRLAETVKRVEKYLRENPDHEAIFVTFTQQTCVSADLKKSVGHFMASNVRMMRRVKVKNAVQAWARFYELTYNADKQRHHFHAHVLIFVDPQAYFARKGGTYLSQAAWAAEFQQALRSDYKPVVDVRKTGIKAPLDEAGRATLVELCKYLSKPGTLVAWRDGVPEVHGTHKLMPYDCGDGQGLRPVKYAPLRAVIDALKGRRMHAYSAKLSSPDDDLDFADDPGGEDAGAAVLNLGELICTEVYRWRSLGRARGTYQLIARVFQDEGRGHSHAAMMPESLQCQAQHIRERQDR